MGRNITKFSQNTPSETQKPTKNEPRKDCKNLSLSWGEWNSSTEQVFLSGYSNGWNHLFQE